MSTLGVEQFPSCTLNTFYLTIIFLAQRELQSIKKVSQNRTKYCNETNKTIKQTTFFSAKNKQSISEPNFTKSVQRKVRFGQIFF